GVSAFFFVIFLFDKRHGKEKEAQFGLFFGAMCGGLEQNLKKRLNDARCEMEYKKYYDYVVVNDELEKAARKLEAIIVSERDKCKKSQNSL
ncbi:MAG TPA: hypothetical protein PKJ95_02110, partial [Atribacterota bacterium]|nr:hypothetical protein [Atribacterota bacterium]